MENKAAHSLTVLLHVERVLNSCSEWHMSSLLYIVIAF